MSGIKECRKCKETKALQHFSKKASSPDGYRGKCKACVQRVNQLYLQRTKRWYNAYKATLCCPCGENHPACLEFHHRDPATKIKAVSDMVADGYSIPTVKREIDKCDVMCANCHRKKHYLRSIR